MDRFGVIGEINCPEVHILPEARRRAVCEARGSDVASFSGICIDRFMASCYGVLLSLLVSFKPC